MGVIEEYQKALQEQKKLITNLSSSGPAIPGLNVEDVAKRLAELDTNLQDSVNYYKDLADQERIKEELDALNSGIVESAEAKSARIERKRKQAEEETEKIVDGYIESQRDFIQEQIAIIEVNSAVIQGEVESLPALIIAAGITASLPTAVGLAVPNYLYNIGVFLQSLKGFAATLKLIKTAFLNVLIAADKIKFVLPEPITILLNKITAIEDTFKKEGSKTRETITPPPVDFEGFQTKVSKLTETQQISDFFAGISLTEIQSFFLLPQAEQIRLFKSLSEADLKSFTQQINENQSGYVLRLGLANGFGPSLSEILEENNFPGGRGPDGALSENDI